MKCDICSMREAVIHIQQMSAGAKTELHLCRVCAAERGLKTDGSSLDLSFNGLVSGISALQNLLTASAVPRIPEEPEKLCPVCGRSVQQIKKTGTAGCPECYEIFAQEIRERFAAAGINGPYTGRMPRQLANFRSVLTDRIMLRRKMEESIAREDYEKAALYRDKLKVLGTCAVADGSCSDAADCSGEGHDSSVSSEGGS